MFNHPLKRVDLSLIGTTICNYLSTFWYHQKRSVPKKTEKIVSSVNKKSFSSLNIVLIVIGSGWVLSVLRSSFFFQDSLLKA